MLLKIFYFFFAVMGFAAISHAHEVNPAVVDITVSSSESTLDIHFNAEVFLADIDASIVTDTNNAEQSMRYDQLRALDYRDIENRLAARKDELLDSITLRTDGQTVPLSLVKITTEENNDFSVTRQTLVRINAALSDGGSPVTLRLNPRLGAYIIRQNDPTMDQNKLYSDYIAAGFETLPIPRNTIIERSWHNAFFQYIKSGIVHIIPRGLDHIVFIMGLYFFSPRLKSLLMQVTVFTFAHSFTLALSSLKFIYIPASIVEPLIALSIVWIGIENIVRPKIGIGRLFVIFSFGLLHGLGFAFVLGEVGLTPTNFVVSLIGFNIGVELGQLLVLVPLVIMGFFINTKGYYTRRVEQPASFAIAMTGLYWFLERVSVFL